LYLLARFASTPLARNIVGIQCLRSGDTRANTDRGFISMIGLSMIGLTLSGNGRDIMSSYWCLNNLIILPPEVIQQHLLLVKVDILFNSDSMLLWPVNSETFTLLVYSHPKSLINATTQLRLLLISDPNSGTPFLESM
jgi:hypothetical protein